MNPEMQSAMFAQLVLQQSNMAMMLLGKIAHPETGETVRDVEAAKFFIDQLEMLEAKTKGNLTKEEDALLKQTLMTLHMTFVETVQSPEQPAVEPEKLESPSKPPETTEAKSPEPADESPKRFSKKY